MALVNLRTNLADWSTTKKKPSEANPAPVNFFDAGGVNTSAGATGFTKNFNNENASKFLGISSNNQSYTYPATVRGNRLMKPRLSATFPGPQNFINNTQSGATGFQLNVSSNSSKFLGISSNNDSYIYPATVRGNRLMKPNIPIDRISIAFPGPQNFIDDNTSGASGFRLRATDPNNSAFLGITNNNQSYIYPVTVQDNRLMKPNIPIDRISIAFPGPQNFIDDNTSGASGFRLRATDPNNSAFLGISSNNDSYTYPATVRGNRLMKPNIPIGKVSTAFPGPQNFIDDINSGASGFRLNATDKFQSAFLGISSNNDSYIYPDSVVGVQGNSINKVPYLSQTATFANPIGTINTFRYSNNKDRVATQGNAFRIEVIPTDTKRYGERVKSVKGDSSLSPLFAKSTKENSPSAITEQYTKFHITDEAYNPTYLAQPYIVRGIQRRGDPNPQRWGFNVNFDDGLVPAGTVAYTERIGADVARVAQFIASPKGLLWTAKQAGLQLSNPFTENDTRVFNPIQLVANVATAPLGIRVQRHGLIGVTRTYEQVVAAKNAGAAPGLLYKVPAPNGGTYNRLLALTKEYFVGLPIRTLVGLPSGTLSAPFGGPKSVYGIGFTTISRTVNSMDRETSGFPPDGRFHGSLDYTKLQKSEPGKSLNDFRNDVLTDFVSLPAAPGQPNAKTIADSVIGKQDSNYYTDFNLEAKYGFGKQGQPGVAKPPSRGEGSFLIKSYTTDGQDSLNPIDSDNLDAKKTKRFAIVAKSEFRGDKINATDVSTDDKVVLLSDDEIYPTNTKDIIRFYFEDAIQGRHVIAMRATITGLSDSFSPSWSRIDILGYPAGAYSYNTFERSVSFNFIVAATSRSEMIPIWRKLNYLASYTMPDYVDDRPTGPFMRLTLGDLYKNAPGFIESLTYSVPDETTWDIADDYDKSNNPDAKQLPTVIEVSVTYKMISNYLPQKLGAAYDLGRVKAPGNWLADSKVAVATTN